MTNDDLDRNMGRAGQEDDFGGEQRSPGRNPSDQQTGQKGAGQKNYQGDEEGDLGTGGESSGQMGRTPQGGQNR
jgi:hypothetical protein